jgi:hypothetical protein
VPAIQSTSPAMSRSKVPIPGVGGPHRVHPHRCGLPRRNRQAVEGAVQLGAVAEINLHMIEERPEGASVVSSLLDQAFTEPEG